MTNVKDGGPAFNNQWQGPDGYYRGHVGMSLRDWFAGQPDITGSPILIGLEQGEALAGRPAPEDPLERYRWQCEVQAAMRYIAADAMLKARETTHE